MHPQKAPCGRQRSGNESSPSKATCVEDGARRKPNPRAVTRMRWSRSEKKRETTDVALGIRPNKFAGNTPRKTPAPYDPKNKHL